ncbi:hypothetical protein NFI96_009816 [Prochilodus magdalenae]|nr:hypothetical protein NFI96_009816 [Prochilodus magdalenae]
MEHNKTDHLYHGFKLKKLVITTWYLSLAVSDFIFCSTLPFYVIHKVTNNWPFGLFMCKFNYFIMWLNMYSSIFLLTIISVDRCVVVMFPVWAQNQRTHSLKSTVEIPGDRRSTEHCQSPTAVNVSDQTIRNMPHEGGLRARCPVVGPVLTGQHRRA